MFSAQETIDNIEKPPAIESSIAGGFIIVKLTRRYSGRFRAG